MAALCVLKMVATLVSYCSGNAGGIFAPSLYIGAMAGGALGIVVHSLAPFPTADPGAYALVGMGVLFAGIIRAPMTSVFMIFEITQDYQILVPLMVANMLSYAISRRYQPVPVYHALLEQDGIHLPSPAAEAITPQRTARHVMQTEMAFVPSDASIDQAWQLAREQESAAVLVGRRERLDGCVRREQLAQAVESGRGAEPVMSLVEEPPAHVHPDHAIDVVLDRLNRSGGLLPVVSRMNARRVEGVITPNSIVRSVADLRWPQGPGPRAQG
jgi:CIC family chloride channel protein